MRTAVNLSLPPNVVKEIKKAAKSGEYGSVSEFVRDVMLSFLADQKLLADLKRSGMEIKAGKAKKLKSWEDLLSA